MERYPSCLDRKKQDRGTVPIDQDILDCYVNPACKDYLIHWMNTNDLEDPLVTMNEWQTWNQFSELANSHGTDGFGVHGYCCQWRACLA